VNDTAEYPPTPQPAGYGSDSREFGYYPVGAAPVEPPGQPGTRSRRPGGLAAVAIIASVTVVVVVAIALYRAFTPGAADVRNAAQEAAYELRRTPVHGLGIYLFDVQEALAHGAPRTASRLQVSSAGHDTRGDLYEITNNRGDHPVCLAVLVDIDLFSDKPSFPTAEVSDGRC
jgi:hypothetical protein